MRKIELVKGVSSSVLGFGCAPILGSVSAQKARRALDCAIDNGITHFDLARSYGYGEAEKFVGKHLKTKRQDIILASKAGIKANYKAKLLAPVKPLIRYALSKLKLHKNSDNATTVAINEKQQIADQFHYRIDLNSLELKKSLEQSLKALGTDYLDYFFIHEPLHSISNIDELRYYANELKKEGKIKAWGLAYMQDQKHLHTSYLDEFDIHQYNNSPGMVNYQDSIAERAVAANIFFSPLKGGNRNMTPSQKLIALSQDFPNSIILCSMFNEKHLKSNADLFNDLNKH